MSALNVEEPKNKASKLQKKQKKQKLDKQDANKPIVVKKSTFSLTQKIILIINVIIIIFSIGFLLRGYHKLISLYMAHDPRDSILSKYLECDHNELKFHATHYSEYWVMRNIYIGTKVREIGCADAVTYVTHGTDLSFFPHLIELMKSWNAPVSACLYAPGNDFSLTLQAIQYVRICTPQFQLIRQYVTFHIFFPYDHTPERVPHSEDDALEVAVDCKSFSFEKLLREKSYAHQHELPYPINVARNIARKAVNTHFILISDIDNRPLGTGDLSKKFLNMILEKECHNNTNDKGNFCNDKTEEFYALREVYYLRLFAVQPNITMPQNMQELQQLQTTYSTGVVQIKEMPIYIGETRVPIYDERIYSEGKWHSHVHYYAMCLQEYKYMPLNQVKNADFITIRHNTQANTEVFSGASDYMEAAKDIIEASIMPEYPMLFGDKVTAECNKCFFNPKKCYPTYEHI